MKPFDSIRPEQVLLMEIARAGDTKAIGDFIKDRLSIVSPTRSVKACLQLHEYMEANTPDSYAEMYRRGVSHKDRAYLLITAFVLGVVGRARVIRGSFFEASSLPYIDLAEAERMLSNMVSAGVRYDILGSGKPDRMDGMSGHLASLKWSMGATTLTT